MEDATELEKSSQIGQGQSGTESAWASVGGALFLRDNGTVNHEELCAQAKGLLRKVDSDAVIADLARASILVQLALVELLVEIRNELRKGKGSR